MTTSTSFAQKANNLLNVLQGYTNSIRLLLVMFLTLTVSANAWGATISTFTTTSGKFGDVSYNAYKGGGTSNPAVNSNAIRLYQNASGTTGGYIVLSVPDGYTITSATIKSTMATTTGYYIDSNPGATTPAKANFEVNNKSLSANTEYTVSGLSTQYITFACFGTSSSSRLYVSYLSVTYQSAAAKTYNVTLSRNGVTETISDVKEGTQLNDIDGTGDQGGCSPEWVFEGWSKTQRSAQNNTEVMDLVTTVDGAGPYYAVYSHTDEDGGGNSTATMSSFSAVSGNVNNDANVSYEAAKGAAGTAPAIYSNVLRIYQNGGTLTITSKNGKKLTSITIGSGMATSVSYKIDGGEENSNQSIAANGKFTLSEIEASSVLFTCKGTTSSSRLYLNYLSVTYSGGSTVYYTTSPECATQTTVTLNLDGGSFDSKPDGWEEDGNNYTKMVNSGDQVTLPEPDKTGYDFEGWYNASTKVTSPYTLTGNTTLTAHWTPQTYDITYKDQGDDAFSGTHENNHPTQHTYGTATTLKSATKSNYNFLGWFTTSDCSGSAITQLGATDYTSNITLYAKWTQKVYTVTATSNNNNYGTVSVSGATITASPKTGYTYANPAYTVTSGTATVTQNGNTFTVTPSSDCSIQINFEAKPKYTVTLVPGSGSVTDTELEETSAGDGVTLPEPTLDCGDWEFAGWKTTSAVTTETTTEPTLIPAGAYSPTSNITLYAVYKRTEITEGTPTVTTTTDELTRATTGIANNAGYGTWSDKKSNSSAVYAGQSAGGNDAIQLRTTNSNSGIITTTSGGKAKKVTVVWQSSTADGRILDIYGKNSAYTAATDLYSTSTQGTKLGSIAKGSTTLTITGDYEYIGLRSNSGAMYLTSISIDWATTSAGGTITTTYYHSTPDCGTPTPTPTLNVNPATLTFENTTTNTSTEKTFTLTGSNLTENASLQLSGIDPEMFSLSSNSVTQSAGSINQTITVTYTPTATGSHNATLTISSTGAESKTVTLSGTGVAPAAKYTVTFDAGSGSCSTTSLQETSSGAGVTLPTANPPATCATDGWKFAGWWTESVAGTTTSPGELLTADLNYKPTSNCTLYAVYSYTEAGGSGSTDYVLTNIKDIADDDIVVITMTYTDGTVYALSNSNGSSDTPPAPIVTVSDNKLSAEPADALKWNISNSSGTLTVYPNGTTEKWLYCTNSNDGVRIGTNTNKAFAIDASSGYLKNTNTNRYVGVYRTNPDWRCYENTTGNTANQTLGFYVKSSGGTTTTYNSNPTCLVPVWNGATIDKTALTVNCGERSSMDGAAQITFSKDKISGFSNPITIEASEGFLVSTSRTPNENYQQSVSQSPLVGTEYPNTFNGKFVYVRAEAPAQSDTDLEGTITIKNNKGETLQTFSVTADVTCTTYTLTLNDRSTKTTAEYYAGASVPEPEDPEGVCTDPIHYVFDGWAEATVAEGSTTYTKVTFPYSMPGQNKTLYAVYRYVEEGSGDSGDYVKVTENLDDYSGDYLIVYEVGNVAFDGGRNNVDDELDATSNTIEVTINVNTIASNATTDAAKFTIAKVDGGYSIKSASGYYIGRSAASNGLSTNETYSANYDLNTITDCKTIKGKGGYILKYNKDSNQKRFRYYKSGQEDIALYRKAASYLYTTSPVCGPHLAITEGKDIYVTGGNAGGIRDLVIAQKKVSYKATRLQTSNGLTDGTAPDVKVATNGITVGGVVTSDVKVTIDQTKEQQTDGTYTITGTITVQYQPSANGKQEDIQVQLAVDYNAEARDNFTIHARSLPAEFVIVAKSGDKWYALNGDMNTNAANPANGQVTLDDVANPTKATYAPCNAIYTFDGLPNTGDRTYVRFQGTDGAWLWASSGTNVGIQNNVLKTTPEGNNNAYNWKLYTEDNITYRFGNANSNRQLTLSGEKFGMYASGVQDIRILPYEEKCLYNYAPTNLKVSVLKGTYVTLTWDAVAGATKYQYSTNGTNWTDAGTDPTVTINGLTGATEYTYYIRADHEDAGVSQECIDYAEITFTTADCDDVPTNITYTADLSSITVSWTAAAPTATITYNTKEDGTGGGGTINNATSPWKISTLSQNTTYYLQIFSDGTCASPIVPVKTEDVEVDIVEWMPDSIIVDINTNEDISVTLENEVSYGSGSGSLAEDLFFSKYFEGSGSLKMIAIYNGTGKDVNLSEYRIDRGSNGDATNISKTYDLSQLGIIKQGQEIIFYSWPLSSEYSYSCSQSFLDSKVQESGLDANPRWILCDAKTHNGIEFEAMDFSGNDPLLLYKSSELIDVFGVSTEQESPASTQICSGRSDEAWSADGVTNMDYGKTTEDFPNGEIPHGVNVDDETITAYTARVIMFRKNTVVSGTNAVTKNTTTFATFAEEWEARQVCMSGDDGDLTCAAYQELGTFDYSDYYTKYETMGDEQIFDEKARNADGTVTISIPELSEQSCRNIRIIIKDNTKVISNQEYKVPIMITTTQGTDGQAFLALQENLATVEVDGSGNPTGNKTNLTLEQVREICKTCDVVVRDNATLMKMADDAANDHPQVRNIYVYENSSLIVPNGTNYTINNLSLRRKGDEVSSLSAYPDALKLPESAATPISLDLRVDANNWHWFTLPYDCNIADVTWVDGSAAQYNVDWFLMTYDGKQRASTQNGGCWEQYNGTTIEAGKGYIVGITGDLTNPNYTFELRFPMAKEVLANEGTDKTVDVRAWGVETNIRPNHKGWNLVGNPYLAYYQRDNITNFEGLRLGQLTGPDPQTGYWEQTGNVPYVVIPIEGGWVSYEQVLASETELMPFTAYFVQVGNDGEHNSNQELSISFDHTKLQLSATPMPASIVRRAPAEIEETEEPIIVGVSLTNGKGESDKTSLVIDDRFTKEYEMNGDFFKWFGDYYNYYTKPVLYTIGADQEKRAFNALNEELAAQPIPMGMYAAQAGNYTFSLNKRADLSRVEEVWLYDATQSTYTNLMQSDYTFSTSKVNGAGRFSLSVKLAPKVATSIDNVTADKVWATTHTKQVIVNGLENGMHLWLYDATGKLLYTEPTSNYQHTYSVPQTGTYFVSVMNGNAKQTIKVVVE